MVVSKIKKLISLKGLEKEMKEKEKVS